MFKKPSTLVLVDLKDRKQYVSFKQIYSAAEKNQYGVPQGSSLGPLFFLIYINDLANALNYKSTLSANDTCLTVRATNIDTLETE